MNMPRGGVAGGGADKKRRLPKGPHRSKMKGPTRGRKHHEALSKQPSRMRHAAADHMIKASRDREEMHPSLKRLSKTLRSHLYKKVYDKDRDTPDQVC